MLNVVLLVTCICIVVVLILYLFFWNRCLGYLFGLVFRLLYWSQGESSVWLDIGSVHFSILSGRILFKDLRYHSSNQTIRVVKGQLSWRYWIRRPAEEEDLSHARVVGEDLNLKGHSPLSCRIHTSLQGVEWFIYNRTAAYDNIVSQMEVDDMPSTPLPTPARGSMDDGRSFRRVFSGLSGHSALHGTSMLGPRISLLSSMYRMTPSFFKRMLAAIKLQLPNFDPKNLLPVSIEATKAAIICGNASTQSLLVADFSKAEGTYGIVQARSKYDMYKQVLNLKFHNASVHYVENADYRAHMTDVGEKVHEHIRGARGPPLRQSSYLSYFSFEKLWSSLKLWTDITHFKPHTRRLFACMSVLIPHPPTVRPWHKKKKDDDDETPLGADFSTLEYAAEPKILEAPVLELLYYADVVGLVPIQKPQKPHSDSGGVDPFDIGNGDLPPEWGIDFVVRGGFLRYGPWADRQRVELQQTFFPQMFHNVEPNPRLKAGDMRMWTGLKVFIELRDGVTLHIPFREASKNWQWDGKSEVPNRPRKREPASIHVRAGDSSTISYILPMVAGPQGYQSSLEVHLDTVTVTSSLNDIRLVTAESCRLRCHLPTPLMWNGERQWNFTVSLRQTSLFLLRDHINMLTDLGKDWSAGPPGDYNRFIPMVYAINVDLHNYEINMYVNDHNIIDKPLIREDNTMLTLRGTHFQNGVRIPFVKYRPEATTISFWIEAPDVAVNLTLPRWNTYTLFATPDRSNIGTIGILRLDAAYHYYAEVREDNLDHLKMDFTARDVVYRAFGWTIRHFMILRDNYFGSFTHFSTLYEYLEKRKRKQSLGDPIDLQYRPGNSNPMEVELALNVEQGLVALPAGFPGYEMYGPEQAQSKDNDLGACLLLSIPGLQVQLRTNDYYMEMSLDVDTVSGRVEKHCTEELLLTRKDPRNFKESFVIDGIDITANRLFGPQPHTSTYFCIWEIHIGDVKAVLSAYEGRLISAVGSSLGFNFSDPLNAPAHEYAVPLDPDGKYYPSNLDDLEVTYDIVTFLNFLVDTVNVVWLVDGAAAELSFPKGLRISSNDLAGKFHRKVTSIRLPHASVKALLASRKSGTWYEATDVIVDANIDIYSAPPGWKESARAQTEFLAAQDNLTGRARFCYSVDDAELSGDGLPSGRVLRDSDLYLPQLRIPGRSASARGRGRTTELSAATRIKPPHNPLLSTFPLQSESEGDDVLSEADRDARLANARPITSLHGVWHTDDDESNISGEESDNEDLTESQGWDSDESNDMEDLSTDGVWPSAAQYSVLAKHYMSFALTRPSLWDVSPFKLSRNTIPSCRRNSARASSYKGDDKTGESPWNLLGQHPDQEVDATIFRVLCKKGLSIWLTPLLLPVVEELLKDLSGNQLSPELRFDAMMTKYIQTISSDSEAHDKTTSFDVHLSFVQLHSIQFVDSGDPGIFDGRDDGIKSCLHLKEGIATAVDLRLDDWHISGSLAEYHAGSPSQHSITTYIGDLSLSLLTEQEMTAVDGGLSIHPTCHISFSRSRISMVAQELVVVFDDLAANLGHAAPEVVLATAAVTSRFVQCLSTSHKRSSTHTPALDQQIIHQVLKYSRQRPVVDPLSTIQPSYLVQTGRPDMLRKNTSFKFLVYLRVCLRYLEGPERRAVVGLQPDLESRVSLQEVLSTLDSQYFSHVGEDDTSLSQQSLLQDLFPPLHSLPGHPNMGKTRTLVTTVSLHLERMSVILHHPDDDVQSSFSLSSLVILLHVRSTDFLHLSMMNLSKSLPNLSLRDKDRLDIQHVAVSMSLGKVATIIFPQLMRFIQITIRASRYYSDSLASSSTFPPSASTTSIHSLEKPLSILYLDFVLSTRSLRFTAAAHKLIVEFSIAGVTYASTSLTRPPSTRDGAWSLSTNHSLNFDECSLRARSGSDVSKQNDDGILASLILRNGRTNVLVFQEPHIDLACRVFLGLETLHLNIPRSALRLYRFIEEWRADYLPGIDAAMQALLSEFHQGSKKPASLSSQSSQRSRAIRSTIQVHMSVSLVKITLQVMLGTWLSCDVTKSVIHVTSASSSRRKRVLSLGLQMGPHIFVIASRAQTADDVDPTIRIKLELPVITLKGRHDESGMHGIALIEFFHMTLKPSDLDTLLSVQQKSGQDFYDFLHLIGETRQRTVVSATKIQPQPGTSHKFNASFRMKGFRVGLEGPASAVLLECDDIGGGYESVPTSSWHIKLSDLALSLASSNVRTALDRGHRSAFVTIDFQANMGSRLEVSRAELLQVSVTKVHAVMHPTSIGEFGDFIDYLQAEVFLREEERAHELAVFKEKTRSIMRSLDVKSGETQNIEDSWLDKYNVKLTIRNVGVAFPLSLGRDLHMPRSGSQDNATVPAFLFSIKSITFGTHHGESGQATMKGFSFQFVSRFRQSVAADFSGESHQTRNRLLYPEMTAQLRSERSSGSRRIRIGADVSGFILDLDSTMPEYIFSLIDVYRQGKDWMDRLGSSAPRPSTSPSRVQVVKAESQFDALPTSNILISLTFSSGKVLLHCPDPITDQFRNRSFSAVYEPSIGVETFDLPVVSVWGEYRAAPVVQQASSNPANRAPSTLMFKSTIHSSQNTLKPALLPFITAIVDRVERRMRSTTRRTSQSSPLRPHEPLPSIASEGLTEHVLEPAAGMQISLSLRIDQSKLELTCQPDVNVIAGLHWDSGGFVINISPGVRRVVFTGNVGGLTVGLKHGFLSEDCVKLDARNLTFNTTFAKMELEKDKITSSISVVLDTEFAGGVRLSRLQDVLCFKAVWLDRIPVFSGQETSTSVSRAAPSPKQELTTAVLLRFRRIQLDADLGQSISSIKLNLTDVLLRTKLSETLSELSLSVAELAVLASGNLSGQVSFPDFHGALAIELESEYQKLIQYRAEPVEVLIYDDWSRISSEVPVDERRVEVTSSVSGTDVIIVMNVGTIPRLVSYANKFKANLDAQKEGASRESKAFRIASSPKPDNPLSAVANAMLKSTRSRLKEADIGISYTIVQRMSLKLDRLRLIVFPRSMRDMELAQFIGRDVHARLDRLVISNALPSQRDLHLSFSSITTSKITQLNHALVTKEKIAENQQWLLTLMKDAPEATIFGLPSMDIRMQSQEILRGTNRTLCYDFSSKFIARQGAKDADDIYITLNMSLYSWLTLLRKTFAREMEQVQAAADVRLGSTVLAQQSIGLQRKKVPEPLALSVERDGQRSPSPDLLDPLSSRSPRSPLSSQVFRSMPSPSGSMSPADGRPRSSTLLSPPAKSPTSPPSPSRLTAPPSPTAVDSLGITYEPQHRSIERLTMRQLGEATPDAGFSLEDSLPQYVHEYATMPAEEIMKALLKLYSKQLSVDESTDIQV
ncbi:hypothetical protein B0H21DRAFT_878964 [Amylocystis lapponica]|nr:hypothetical protein B0H21DRAFT_878964 [Amylocystis lapponica]